MSTSRRKAQKNNMSAAFSPTVDFEPFLERNNLLLPTEKLRPFRLSHRPTNRQTEKPTNKAVKFIFPFSFFPPPPVTPPPPGLPIWRGWKWTGQRDSLSKFRRSYTRAGVSFDFLKSVVWFLVCRRYWNSSTKVTQSGLFHPIGSNKMTVTTIGMMRPCFTTGYPFQGKIHHLCLCTSNLGWNNYRFDIEFYCNPMEFQ